MWDYTEYNFKCPYCGHEYKQTVGGGNTYEYKEDFYDWYRCPNCEKDFLGKYREGVFVKMPEDKNELKTAGVWMS